MSRMTRYILSEYLKVFVATAGCLTLVMILVFVVIVQLDVMQALDRVVMLMVRVSLILMGGGA